MRRDGVSISVWVERGGIAGEGFGGGSIPAWVLGFCFMARYQDRPFRRAVYPYVPENGLLYFPTDGLRYVGADGLTYVPTAGLPQRSKLNRLGCPPFPLKGLQGYLAHKKQPLSGNVQ